MHRWQLQEAKAKFSQLIRRAAEEGPQEITVHGRPAAVLLSKDQYDELVIKRPSFVEFMRKSPLFGLDLEFERDRALTGESDFPDFEK